MSIFVNRIPVFHRSGFYRVMGEGYQGDLARPSLRAGRITLPHSETGKPNRPFDSREVVGTAQLIEIEPGALRIHCGPASAPEHLDLHPSKV